MYKILSKRDHEPQTYSTFWTDIPFYPRKRYFVTNLRARNFAASGQLRAHPANSGTAGPPAHEHHNFAHSRGAGKVPTRTARNLHHWPKGKFLRDRCRLLPLIGCHTSRAKLPVQSGRLCIWRANGSGTANNLIFASHNFPGGAEFSTMSQTCRSTICRGAYRYIMSYEEFAVWRYN
jgi:hypothetical protein